MKLRDLPGWPPRGAGSYNSRDEFSQSGTGILKSVEVSAHGQGFRVTIESGDRLYSRTIPCGPDTPSPRDIVAALSPHYGTAVARLGDIDLGPPQK